MDWKEAAEAGGEVERLLDVTIVRSLAGGGRMDSSGWALRSCAFGVKNLRRGWNRRED
jgi:hypothetical protein